MPSVCLYLQMHQPQRLIEYSALDIGRHLPYFNHRQNRDLLHKVADRSYLPTAETLLKLIRQHDGAFKLGLSISGMLLEQIEYQRPDVLKVYQQLAETGCVEFLAETYFHSLSFLYSREEFFRQVILHKEKIWKHFAQDPAVFQNTELIYNNQLAYFVRQMGFRGVITEGIPALLKGRSPNQAFLAPDLLNMQLLLRNSPLSDDLGFRFQEMPVADRSRAESFAQKIHQQEGDRVNLFLDLETFGERISAEDGVWEFLSDMPGAILQEAAWKFSTPSELLEEGTASEIYDAQHFISWADQARDLSAWRGNELQQEALQKVYELEMVVLNTRNQEILRDWSLLQASDHFYFMDTKIGPDGALHDHFRPYANAYDAYLAFMNVVADFQLKLRNAGRG